MKIISYCLFNFVSMTTRDYDPSERDVNRYWFNIPFLAAVNKIFYPDFTMRIYVNSALKEHFLYPLLTNLASCNLIDLITCKYEDSAAKPSLWRMIPVWEDNEVVTVRDMDSIPNCLEIRSVLAFLNSSFIVQNIRTHGNHNSPYCRLLAGLCSFKNGIKGYLDRTFNNYYVLADGNWGCDQSLLIWYFIDRLGPKFVKECLLDTVIYCIFNMCEQLAGHDAGKIPQEEYDKIDLSYIPSRILELSNQITSWPGQPVDARGAATKELLAMEYGSCKSVYECVSSSQVFKDFYQI